MFLQIFSFQHGHIHTTEHYYISDYHGAPSTLEKYGLYDINYMTEDIRIKRSVIYYYTGTIQSKLTDQDAATPKSWYNMSDDNSIGIYILNTSYIQFSIKDIYYYISLLERVIPYRTAICGRFTDITQSRPSNLNMLRGIYCAYYSKYSQDNINASGIVMDVTLKMVIAMYNIYDFFDDICTSNLLIR